MNKIKKIAICILLLAFFALSSGCIEIGKGVSVDSLYGLEYNGLVWKTYSVWLTNDHPYEGHSAIYSVSEEDIELVQQVKLIANTGKKVKVYYKNELAVWPWEYSSETIIYKVEELQ